MAEVIKVPIQKNIKYKKCIKICERYFFIKFTKFFLFQNDRGHQNPTFTMDETDKKSNEESRCVEITREIKKRSKWNNEIEFLMSCIAISIGFGNIWRFPFTAYENGGGVFLIPYIIVLFLVGKPIYYMEIILGQFSSSSSINVWNISPGFSGN